MIKLSSVTITPSKKTIKVGETIKLDVSVCPCDATRKSVTWVSENVGIATVSEKGEVTGKGVGDVVITATAKDGGGAKGTCSITVLPDNIFAVSSISLDKESATVKKGNHIRLSATVFPPYATNPELRWSSSNPCVAEVDSCGTVYGVARGTVTITCKSTDGSDKTAKCKVTVTEDKPVTSITIDPAEVTIKYGESKQLKATVYPTNATNKSVRWESGSSGVIVNPTSGIITGTTVCTETVTAKAQDGSGVKAICKVNVVVSVPVNSITLSRETKTLEKGDNFRLSATVCPENADIKSVRWSSSNTSVATVNNGIVTAHEKGMAVITCSANDGSGVQAVCTVTVTEDKLVTSITIDPPSATLKFGESMLLKAIVCPSDATNKSVRWGGTSSGIPVNQSGIITGLALGTETVTAEAQDGSGVKGSCKVTVVESVLVESITLSKSRKILEKGDCFTLTATVCPENADIKGVNWSSSNASVATVKDGVVTAHAAGKATITCSAKDNSGKKATCTVTVTEDKLVSSVTIDRKNVTMKTGDALQLKAAVVPDNATNKGIQWSSNNTRVATVNSSSGIVTAQADGNAIITATALDGGGAKDTCTVTVSKKILVNSIMLNKYTLSLHKNTSFDLTATVCPENAGNRAVSWSSSNTSVATVSNSGKVTAHATGEATITCSALDGSGISKSCKVSVIQLITYMNVTPASYTMNTKETKKLEVSFQPSDATNKEVHWRSDNENVAAVDESGVVTPKSEGTTRIYAFAQDGSNESDYCTITVKKHIPVESIKVISLASEDYIDADHTTIDIYATLTPTNATNMKVVWKSSDPDIMSVEHDYIVQNYNFAKLTSKKKGTVKITATTEDGGHKATLDITADPREKVKIISDIKDGYFSILFVDRDMEWKSIGDPSKFPSYSEERQYAVERYNFNKKEYSKGTFDINQLAFIYLIDPQGVSYFVENNAMDLELTPLLNFRDKLYEKIFGEKPRYFTLDDDGKMNYNTQGYARKDMYSYAELIFGSHPIWDWDALKEFLLDVAETVITSLFLDKGISAVLSGIVFTIDIARAILFSSSIAEGFNDIAKTIFYDRLGSDLNPSQSYLLNWAVFLMEHLPDTNTFNPMEELKKDVVLYEKIERQNYNVKVKNFMIKDIIERLVNA